MYYMNNAAQIQFSLVLKNCLNYEIPFEHSNNAEYLDPVELPSSAGGGARSTSIKAVHHM